MFTCICLQANSGNRVTAIEMDPQFANAYYNRGIGYQKLGKTVEAEADFRKYEELMGQKP